MEGLEGGQQQEVRRHKLHGAGKDEHAHEQGVPHRKPLAAHEKPIGHAEKKEADANGQGIGQGSAKGCGFPPGRVGAGHGLGLHGAYLLVGLAFWAALGYNESIIANKNSKY